MKAVVGVLALQGDVEEHITATHLALERLAWQGETVWVKTPKDVERIDTLIVPGGESTVMGGLATFNGTIMAIKDRVRKGMPIMGTCAGMITLAKRTYDRVVGETSQPLLGVMDTVIERNSFGRQRESFEADLNIPVLGERSFRGVFIRSPSVKDFGEGVAVLSRLNGTIIAVQQQNMIATAFHPELSGETRLHEFFLQQLK